MLAMRKCKRMYLLWQVFIFFILSCERQITLTAFYDGEDGTTFRVCG